VPLRQKMERALIIAVLCVCIFPLARASEKPCRAYEDLLTTGHLTIRVKLDQVNQGDAWAMKQALNYWATILDISVAVDNDVRSCNLELLETDDSTNRIAYTIMPHYEGFNGVIAYNTHKRVAAGTLVAILIHECGHIFGLCHTRDRRSVMYYRVDGSQIVNGARLREHDIEEVGKLHELRIEGAKQPLRRSEGSRIGIHHA